MTSISLPGASGSFFVRSLFTSWACVAVANPKVKMNTERMSFFMLCLTSVLSVMCCDIRLNRSHRLHTCDVSCLPPQGAQVDEIEKHDLSLVNQAETDRGFRTQSSRATGFSALHDVLAEG